ncbi:hypothetical protein HMPREF9306_00028 [Propionimicrobium lymphophilum ACS-093-V-SCH5]|uniref:Glycosyl transferase family 1 domain-containing protein n=1 Tax=Propionimicrobium lymphophilum ACS-093-V-SCH5 TaxID=883161 RepID=S2W6Z0_9ACTN|nr:glycosyltransferase family 4 protein [Propionimicrobium lymphophilum]EPD33995.1 hypothetical protein HMPREF9306_00028 [Propionimicrobium lymphophilum ACS-093-V-SCH5]
MRIAMVTTWFPTDKNPSAGAFIVKDCQSLTRAGVDIQVVHLVAPQLDDGTRNITIHGLRTIRIPMSTNNPISIAKARHKLEQFIKYADVVHTQAISAIEPFVLRKPRKPWVHTEHWSGISNPHTLSNSWRKIQPALKQLERFPDVVVAVNEYLAAPIRKIRGPKPVAVIPCQVPMPEKLVPRRKISDSLRLISTGGLIPLKRPLLAVEAAAELKAMGRNAELLWLGDGPLRNEVINRAAKLKVKLTLPGHVTAVEVQKSLGRSDIFIGTSEGENFFVSAAEAIVNGRPVVVGAVGGHTEYIDPSVGEIVPGNRPKDYAKALLRIEEKTNSLSSEDIAATIGDSFSSQTIANNYLNLYRKISA